ncbi:MAG: hypothetical protein ACI9T8_000132 [Candidatus Saccharimonadales bacterium]|jgi:hypothetical protein
MWVASWQVLEIFSGPNFWKDIVKGSLFSLLVISAVLSRVQASDEITGSVVRFGAQSCSAVEEEWVSPERSNYVPFNKDLIQDVEFGLDNSSTSPTQTGYLTCGEYDFGDRKIESFRAGVHYRFIDSPVMNESDDTDAGNSGQ